MADLLDPLAALTNDRASKLQNKNTGQLNIRFLQHIYTHTHDIIIIITTTTTRTSGTHF